jgi:hypothetical protein
MVLGASGKPGPAFTRTAARPGGDLANRHRAARHPTAEPGPTRRVGRILEQREPAGRGTGPWTRVGPRPRHRPRNPHASPTRERRRLRRCLGRLCTERDARHRVVGRARPALESSFRPDAGPPGARRGRAGREHLVRSKAGSDSRPRAAGTERPRSGSPPHSSRQAPISKATRGTGATPPSLRTARHCWSFTTTARASAGPRRSRPGRSTRARLPGATQPGKSGRGS